MNTINALKKAIPEIDNNELEIIDGEIKQFIASVEDDIFSQTAEHIRVKLQKYNRYTHKNFLKKCNKLSKTYLKNENEWMTQENLFCLLALIYSCVSLIMRVIQEITEYSTRTSDLIQVIILCIILVAFAIMCESGRIYDNHIFNSFLKQFNRSAPGITILATLLFYLVMCTLPTELVVLKNVLLIACIMFLLLPIWWGIDRTKKSYNTVHNRKNKIVNKWLDILISKIRKVFTWKKIVKTMYQVISVISTLAIFTGVLYFIIGKITNNNQSDNDLIMNQIKAEIGEEQRIVNIEVADIHGFGNDSIIVTTSGRMNEEGDNNKLIILESVENEILNSMNDLLGLKSNYRITFSYGISADDMTVQPEINCVSDILGDSAKEILVDYYVLGSTYGAYYTAVYKYSYESEQYELIGTYPIVSKHDVSKYDDEGNITSSWIHDVDTKFNVIPRTDDDMYTFSDHEKLFNLTSYSYYCRDYWAEINNLGKVLVVVKRDKWEKEALINVYFSSYDEKEGTLDWRVIYSENTTDLSEDYTKDELAKWMENRFNCRVSMY